MEVGADVWIRDHHGGEAWVAGVVLRKEVINDIQITVLIESEYGNKFTFCVEKDAKDIPDVKIRNSQQDSVVDNLINLTHLHEPAILCCLQQRYRRSQIYTYTGPILIAVNPFKRVDHLYSPAVLEEYYNFGLLRAQGAELGGVLSPHVYAIADAAYRDMMKVVLHGYGSDKGKNRGVQVLPANQSILISGESGAGKTESTKIVLKYLTTVGKGEEDTGMVMERILHSNPILEAFGNARTLRNDNSSRFGKFIELNFSKRGVLIGGSVRTYLLEKVRLPIQQQGERNYHIFYQLFTGASEEDKVRWGLTSPDEFAYMSRGGVFRLQHVDDAKEYQALRCALNTLNFDVKNQRELFDVVAGVLHLGQLRFIAFHDGEGEGSSVDLQNKISQESSKNVCDLLGLTEKDLFATLCTRHIVVGGENFLKKLSAAQAADARDALSKAIYSKIFDWIVHTINLSIRVDTSNVRANIGVLDIFGFESFACNSFEQLCINYTNETLQQQFNQYIFKMEQQEYERERIEWSFIEFPDNKDCLELIEHKLNGILAMIDDECRLPKASDEKLAGRMYKAFESNTRFSASIVQRRDFKFSVQHYAGSVEYSTRTFVEKNKDELPKEASNLLQSSSCALLQAVFSGVDKGFVLRSKNVKQTSTVPASMGFQFKEQLANLMESIYATSPHYIRCLKPNDANEADNFHRLRVTEQLRYGGVLEAVRVARSGFPVRLSHGEFFVRYRLTLPSKLLHNTALPRFLVNENLREACEAFVKELHVFSHTTCREGKSMRPSLQRYVDFCATFSLFGESIQIGLSKVFLRKTSYDILEAIRFRRFTLAALSVQSIFRGFQLRRTFITLRWAARLIQRIGRGMLGRRQVRTLRLLVATIRLQSYFRCSFARRRYFRIRSAIMTLQFLWRHKIALAMLFELRKKRIALLVQSLWRMHVCRRSYSLLRKSITTLQNRHRKRGAMQLLKQLRTEAKDLGKLKQSNDLLKQEIENLKQRAGEERERLRRDLREESQHHMIQTKDAEIEFLKRCVEEQAMLVESERRLKLSMEQKIQALQDTTPVVCENCNMLKQDVSHRNNTIDQLRRALAREKEFHQSESEQRDILHTKTVLENENSRLRKQFVEQQVLLDKLQAQLDKERTFSKLPQQSKSTTPSRLPLKDNVVEVPSDHGSNNENFDEGSFSSADYSQSVELMDTMRNAEKKIDVWKAELRHGFRVLLWDLPKTSDVEVLMKLDPTGRIFQFLAAGNRRGFSLFQGKFDIHPLNIADIEECAPGVNLKINSQEQAKTLTIHCKNRKIALRFSTHEERNGILSKLRAIVSAEKIVQKGDRNHPVSAQIEVSSSIITKESRIIPSSSQAQRATRRLSVRETILEGNLASPTALRDVAKMETEQTMSVSDLLKELREAKEEKEKLKLQIFLANNELVEKEELISKLKHQESSFEQKLLEKDNLYKQDAMVRLQLGKRLEQVLFDKEEALEELEQLKIQLDSIKSSLK